MLCFYGEDFHLYIIMLKQLLGKMVASRRLSLEATKQPKATLEKTPLVPKSLARKLNKKGVL